jgi:hemolysin III
LEFPVHTSHAAGTAAARRTWPWEVRADAALHAAGVALALGGAMVLLSIAMPRGGKDTVAAAVYSAALLTMLGCSAAYNLGRATRFRGFLQSLDQSAIFLMIAGTYTPIAVIGLGGAIGTALTGAVWSAATSGVLLRLRRPSLFRRIDVALYLVLGWIGALVIGPLLHAVGATIVLLLGAGGALYTIGVIFHVWESLPFQNVIWHAFVLAAAGLHFAAVLGSMLAP